MQANLSETREAIVVSWTVNQQASGDGVALVEVSTDGTTWTEIARTRATSYTYAIDKSGYYQFRVSGGLGSDGKMCIRDRRITGRRRGGEDDLIVAAEGRAGGGESEPIDGCRCV